MDTSRGMEWRGWVAHRIGAQATWCFAFGLWTFLAGFLLFRRWEGALIQPLLGSQFCAVVMWVLCVSGLFRWSADAIGLHAWRRAIWALSALSGVCILGAVSLGGLGGELTIAGWVLWLVTEGIWTARLVTWSAIGSWHSRIRNRGGLSGLAEPFSQNEMLDGDLPAGVTQRLERARSDAGETLSGLLRVELGAEVRVQTVHVTFCPPFDSVPELNVSQVSGETVSLTVAQLETFGVRIEVRRGASQLGPSSVVLELEVSATWGRFPTCRNRNEHSPG